MAELFEKKGIVGEYIGVGNCILGYPDVDQVLNITRKPNRVYYID